jgi:nitrogen regulatory protein PII
MKMKKKIEIVVENPILKHVLARIVELGAPRYTVLHAESGRGHSGEWDADQITAATRHAMVVVIVSEELADKIVDGVSELFADYPGIVYVSDVQVRRAEYF